MTVTTALATALSDSVLTLFLAVEIVTPDLTVRLLQGGGTATFGGRTFGGVDINQGSLQSVEPVREDMGATAPSNRIVISGVTTAVQAAFKNASIQGGAVNIWMGALSKATGAVVADPELIFFGEVNKATMVYDRNTALIEIDAASGFERLFFADEGVRLNHSTQQDLHGTGDLGAEYISDTEIPLPWASGDARPVLTGAGGGGSGFGGGFGGGGFSFDGGVFSL